MLLYTGKVAGLSMALLAWPEGLSYRRFERHIPCVIISILNVHL
jgi:hypothetical protein